jgi:hypothetical protein
VPIPAVCLVPIWAFRVVRVMSAIVIPFPASRRKGRIDHVVRILQRKHGAQAERYWWQCLMVMKRQMLEAQIARDVIETELRNFADAVFARLPTDPTRWPRGAA